MTGFGAGEAALGEGTLRVELRAVNHRHLDLRVRCAEGLDVAHVIEEQLRARLGRGHVEAQVRWDNPGTRAGQLDMARGREVYAALCALRDELNPGQAVPIEAILNVPGLLRAASSVDRTQAEAAALSAAGTAIAALIAMRVREGEALKRDLRSRTAGVREHVAYVEAERPRVLSAYRDRLEARIAKLLDGSELSVDPARLVQELAWFADKSDVAEELTRLGVHLA
ncbi:MAG TPA: YicC/YloC family endoribonuclease, partial [Polyangiales bacterium]|nr:YicC/YloC family endoribonuclease [Polyangiales bacterium]